MAKKIGEQSKEAIAKFKSEYKDVRLFIQEDEDGNEHHTYFRKPTLEDRGYASKVGGTDGIKFSIALANSVRLAGSDAVMDDDQLKQGFMAEVLKLSKAIGGKVTKL